MELLKAELAEAKATREALQVAEEELAMLRVDIVTARKEVKALKAVLAARGLLVAEQQANVRHIAEADEHHTKLRDEVQVPPSLCTHPSLSNPSECHLPLSVSKCPSTTKEAAPFNPSLLRRHE